MDLETGALILDLERERKIASLCREAMDLQSSDVVLWLREQCDGDQALYDEVQEYLAMMTPSDSGFLKTFFPEAGNTMDWSETAMRGQVIGPYRILAKLGEGGMGSVFLAEQTQPLTRKVALKIVKRIRDPSRKKKISAEVQAMALLSHPHITQVYEVGTTETGHLYFAMEYVPGEPLTHYCDKRRLALEDRLWLLVNVCLGVAHAHGEKILHRDLKPSNILVVEIDGKPVPKIIDFGTVAAQSRPEFDDLSMLDAAGTPVYMSPEAMQVFGPLALDARTDVYALGMILFELLIGLKPYTQDEMGVSRIFEKAAREDLPRPSQRFESADAETQAVIAEKRGMTMAALGSQLMGELDRMTAKAIARNRDQRYESVQALGKDIENYLNRRLPLPAGVVGTKPQWPAWLRRPGLLLLLGLLVAMMVILYKRNGEVQEALSAMEEEAQYAEFLAGTLAQQGIWQPSRAQSLALLDEDLRRAESLQGQPLLKARMLDFQGRQYLRLDDLEHGSGLIEKALAIREAHLPAGDAAILDSQISVGELHAQRGDLDEALAILLEVNADATERSGLLVRKVQVLGSVFGRLGKYQERDTLLTQSLRALKQMPGVRSASLLALQKQIADHHLELGNYGDAERHLQVAMARLPEGDSLRRASLLWRLGEAWQGLGDFNGAKLVLEGSATTGAWKDRWVSQLLLAEISLDQNEPRTAEVYLGACAELEATPYSEFGALRLRYRMAQARMYRKLGEFSAAYAHLQLAMNEADSSFEQRLLRANLMVVAARIQLAMGCEAEARAALAQAETLYEEQAPKHPNRATCLAEIASLSIKLGDLETARYYLQRAKILQSRYCAPESMPYQRVAETEVALKNAEAD